MNFFKSRIRGTDVVCHNEVFQQDKLSQKSFWLQKWQVAGFDSQGWSSTQGLKEMMFPHLPSKQLELCRAQMTTQNGSPVSSWKCGNGVLNF